MIEALSSVANSEGVAGRIEQMVVAKLKDSTVEINDIDDLFRVVKEVRGQDEALIIQFDDRHEIIVPASRRPRRRKLTPEEKAKADDEAFLASAGSLKGLFDPDEFMERVREGRSSNRPVYEITLPDE